MWLPPYSPDFNPIEMAISKIKSLLRKWPRRTVKDLSEAIDRAWDSVLAQDAFNFIYHHGHHAITK
jgi:transposase